MVAGSHGRGADLGYCPNVAESWASSEHARRTMRANRSRDTGPELAVRRHVFAMGLRYRVDYPPLPVNRRSRADLTFIRAVCDRL